MRNIDKKKTKVKNIRDILVDQLNNLLIEQAKNLYKEREVTDRFEENINKFVEILSNMLLEIPLRQIILDIKTMIDAKYIAFLSNFMDIADTRSKTSGEESIVAQEAIKDFNVNSSNMYVEFLNLLLTMPGLNEITQIILSDLKLSFSVITQEYSLIGNNMVELAKEIVDLENKIKTYDKENDDNDKNGGGSLIEDFANPILEMPSYIDPED